MKNQYFGDKRDYFKYDLMLSFTESLADLQRFTFVPMLTPPDDTGHGGKTNYPPGNRRPELYMFLKECIETSSRNIVNLRPFFEEQTSGFEYCPYADDQYFQDGERLHYFNNIPSHFLTHAAILLDPDTGLEVKTMKSKNRHRYVKYQDLKSLYDRMDDTSCISVIQFHRRMKRHRDLEDRSYHLVDRLGCPAPCAISDNEIAFVFLAKSSKRSRQVASFLSEYAARDHKLWVWIAS